MVESYCPSPGSQLDFQNFNPIVKPQVTALYNMLDINYKPMLSEKITSKSMDHIKEEL